MLKTIASNVLSKVIILIFFSIIVTGCAGMIQAHPDRGYSGQVYESGYMELGQEFKCYEKGYQGRCDHHHDQDVHESQHF